MRKIMNKQVIPQSGRLRLIVILLLICCMASIASGLEVIIDNVNVQPELPGISDIVNIEIDGTANYAPSWVDHYDYSQNFTSLDLDLYIDADYLTAFSNWSYSQQIGTLAPGDYVLTVRAFSNDEGILRDTSVTEFTVVPEPTTVVLFGLGGLFMKNFINQKIT